MSPTPEPIKPTCGTCRFHDQAPDLGNVLCHRYPPVQLVTQQGILSMFPQPRRDWVCGEHQPKIIEVNGA